MAIPNVSSWLNYSHKYDTKFIYGLVGINLFISLLGILGNGLVFIVVFKTQGVDRTFRYLISSLAAADLTVALVAQPLFVVLLFGRRSPNDLPSVLLVCRIVGNFALIMSIITTTFIALDRCLKVASANFNYTNTMWTARKKLVFPIACVFACLSASVRLFSNQEISMYFFASVDGLCFVTMIVCYTVICYRVYKQRPFVHSQPARTRADKEEEVPAQTVDRESQLQFARTVVMILLALLIGKVVPTFYRTFTEPEKDYGMTYFTAVTANMSFKVVNPVFYCFDNKNYRRTFKKLLRFLTCRKKEQTERENRSLGFST